MPGASGTADTNRWSASTVCALPWTVQWRYWRRFVFCTACACDGSDGKSARVTLLQSETALVTSTQGALQGCELTHQIESPVHLHVAMSLQQCQLKGLLLPAPATWCQLLCSAKSQVQIISSVLTALRSVPSAPWQRT